MNRGTDVIANTAKRLSDINEHDFDYFIKERKPLPSRREVINILEFLKYAMFRDYTAAVPELSGLCDEEIIGRIHSMILQQVTRAVSRGSYKTTPTEVADELISLVPDVKLALIKDAQAIYEGDPAAVSADEVILTYPGFTAIMIYRIAHEFYLRGVPYIARMMTEYAHELTGIDIHAGATIGEYFFIDHGTGIVIGETTTIGNRVKIYQGVTLGAKSFELDGDGNPVKGIKRHPDIGNGVVIYANATILGGQTKIGDGAVIGANVWLTGSVDAGKVVYYSEKNKNQ